MGWLKRVAWRLYHGVFRKNRPVPASKKNNSPPKKAVVRDISPPKKEKTEAELSEEAQKLLKQVPKEIQSQVRQMVRAENKELLDKIDLLAQLVKQFNLGKPTSETITEEEQKPAKKKFQPVEIDESVANVSQESELEGHISVEEMETDEDSASQKDKLKQLLQGK